MFFKDTTAFAHGFMKQKMPKNQSECSLYTVFDRNVCYLSSYICKKTDGGVDDVEVWCFLNRSNHLPPPFKFLKNTSKEWSVFVFAEVTSWIALTRVRTITREREFNHRD